MSQLKILYAVTKTWYSQNNNNNNNNKQTIIVFFQVIR